MDIQIVSPTPREAWVDLAHPLEVDGLRIDKVRIKRCTGGEVQRFVEMMQVALSKPPGERLMPIVPVVDLPTEIYWALDDDDRLAVDEAYAPFLPRRLRDWAESLQREIGEES